jgi:cytochrome c oxidase subunit IV
MGKGLKTDRIDTPKIILLMMAELFTAASLVAVIMDGEWTRIALTAVTLLFVPLPLCVEYLFRKKLTEWFL